MREPFQVLVILYKIIDLKLHVAIFHRRSGDYWQFVSGGKEDTDENLYESVKREVVEETGLIVNNITNLATTTSIPAIYFSAFDETEFILVTEKCFACDITHIEKPIVLSKEHDKYRFVDVANANAILKWDSNKVALYELEKLLKKEHKL